MQCEQEIETYILLSLKNALLSPCLVWIFAKGKHVTGKQTQNKPTLFNHQFKQFFFFTNRSSKLNPPVLAEVFRFLLLVVDSRCHLLDTSHSQLWPQHKKHSL